MTAQDRLNLKTKLGLLVCHKFLAPVEMSILIQLPTLVSLDPEALFFGQK